MTYEQAVLTFALKLMTTSQYPYDTNLIEQISKAVAETTQDYSEAETLLKIARWESGGFSKDVIDCHKKGDNGAAYGMFQVHPRNAEEKIKLCSNDYKQQVDVALSRIRESKQMCSKFGNKTYDLLAGYTVGRCVKGNKEAKMRYGSGKSIQKLMEKSNAN